MPRLDRAFANLPDLFEPSTLRIVCAWCDAVMVPGSPNGGISHGICESCSTRLEQEEELTIALARAVADGDLSGAWQLGTAIGELIAARRTR